MHLLSVEHLQTSEYGELLTHPPNFDQCGVLGMPSNTELAAVEGKE